MKRYRVVVQSTRMNPPNSRTKILNRYPRAEEYDFDARGDNSAYRKGWKMALHQEYPYIPEGFWVHQVYFDPDSGEEVRTREVLKIN